MKCDAANPKGTGPVDIWQETLPVRFGAIDRSDRLTLSAIFQFFQEAAISHAENLGVGREEMASTGQLWILSRMSVKITRRPKYRESITVRSWPRGGEKLFALRDYDIRDAADIPVVQARSGWIVLDVEKRRPLRPQSVMSALPQNEGLDAMTSSPVGLSARDDLHNTWERKTLYTDLDYNGHVNNVRYIQWIEDALDPEILESADQMRLDINYLNEVMLGEVIEIRHAQFEEENGACKAFAFEGRAVNGLSVNSPANGQAANSPAFRAELRL